MKFYYGKYLCYVIIISNINILTGKMYTIGVACGPAGPAMARALFFGSIQISTVRANQLWTSNYLGWTTLQPDATPLYTTMEPA